MKVLGFLGSPRLNGFGSKLIRKALEGAASAGAETKLIDNIEADKREELSDDVIQEIEHGFLFRIPLLTYRVIGNFADFSMSLKVNIKAMRGEEVFVDTVDLYRNRDRQNFIFNLTDQFNIRDQLQLEQDLSTILTVIEKHKENRPGLSYRARGA